MKDRKSTKGGGGGDKEDKHCSLFINRGLFYRTTVVFASSFPDHHVRFRSSVFRHSECRTLDRPTARGVDGKEARAMFNMTLSVF